MARWRRARDAGCVCVKYLRIENDTFYDVDDMFAAVGRGGMEKVFWFGRDKR